MDKELLTKFRKAFRLFAREFMYLNQNMKYSDLPVLQRHVILEIGENPGTSLGAIAESLNIDKGNLSRSVNDLVGLNYVDRAIDPSNRRSVVLTLTADGTAVFKGIDKMSNSYFMKVFSNIGDENIETVVHGLALLSENMHKENKRISEYFSRHDKKGKISRK